MKKILLTAVAGVCLTSSVMAATTSKSTKPNPWKALRDSPLSLTYLQETETSNDTKGIKSQHLTFLGYKLTDNDSLRMENRWTTSKLSNTDWDGEYVRLVFKYSRSGILKQADHGVNMSAGLEKRFYPNKNIRASSGTYGLNRVSTPMSAKYGKFAVAFIPHFALHDRIDKDRKAVTKSYWYLVGKQDYSFTPKLSAYFMQEFLSENKVKADARVRTFGALGVEYKVLKTLTLGLEVDSQITDSTRKDAYINDWYNKIAYGVAATWSVF